MNLKEEGIVQTVRDETLRGRTLLKSLLPKIAVQTRFADVYSATKQRFVRSHATIVQYHRVTDRTKNWALGSISISPRSFRDHIEYFMSRYEIVPLDDILQGLQERELGHGKLAITFDDGYRDNYAEAYPILAKYSLPFTVFLITGHIGTGEPLWWDRVGYAVCKTDVCRLELGELGNYSLGSSVESRDRVSSLIINKLKSLQRSRRKVLAEEITKACRLTIPHHAAKQMMLSWEEVKRMSRDGVEFGAHSVTHPNLLTSSTSEARWEILHSKRDLERKLAKKAKFFAYPYGALENRVIRLVREQGFEGAVNVSQTWVTRSDNPYLLARIGAVEDLSGLKLLLSGIWGDIEARKVGRYLIPGFR